MKKLFVYTLVVTVLLGLAACSNATTAPGAGLEDTKWILESYGEEGAPKTVLEGTEITATFNRQDSQVKGSGGCNTYFGEYQAKKNELSISNLAWTEIGCLDPEGVMEQEQRYLSALQAAESYTIEDGELRISSLGERVLIFRAK